MALLGVPKGKLPVIFKSANVNDIDAESDFYWASVNGNALSIGALNHFLPIQMQAVEGLSAELPNITLHPPVDVQITKMKAKIVTNTLNGTAILALMLNNVRTADIFTFDVVGTQPIGSIVEGDNLPVTIPKGVKAFFQYFRGTTTIDGLQPTWSGHLKWL